MGYFGRYVDSYFIRNGSAPAAWSTDALSSKGVPATATEWSALAAAAGNASRTPSNLFLMQEPSGNLADSIGSVALIGSGTRAYHQAVTGWSRKSVKTTDLTPGYFSVGAGVGPNAGTSSVAILAYVRFASTPPAERGVMSLSDTTNKYLAVNVTAAGALKGFVFTATATTANAYVGTVHPVLYVYDRTNSRARIYTDLEKLTVMYNAGVVDGVKGFGHSSAPAATDYLYGAWFTGPAAEFSDAEAKSTLQALSWTVPWS